MTTSCTDRNHPYYREIEGRQTGAVNFFLEDEAKRMKYVSLGEALDFISEGFMNGVAYHMDTRKMVRFIRTWMRAQEPRREILEIPTGKHSYRLKEDVSKRQFNYTWNRFAQDFPAQLTRRRINNKRCPRDEKHEGTITDGAVRIRCSHFEIQLLKPSFIKTLDGFDELSSTENTTFYDDKPSEPWSPEEEEDESEGAQNRQERYKAELRRYEDEGEIEAIKPCYAIIKETETRNLPLQTILDRLNVSTNPAYYLNPFSGFTLARYVKAWWNQKGRKRFFRKKVEREDNFRVYPHFVPIS